MKRFPVKTKRMAFKMESSPFKIERFDYLCSKKMKRAIIIGATSGIGKEVRPTPPVRRMADRHSGQTPVSSRRFPANRTGTDKNSITGRHSGRQCRKTGCAYPSIGRYGFISAQFRHRFPKYGFEDGIELNTARTNVEGFTRMVDTAFSYFKNNGGGHLAVISSIAGTKGLGVAPAYSATKRFQNTYIDALEQLAHLQKLNIHFTDIRPGFVATDLLNDGKHYPMLMKTDQVGRDIVRALHRKQRVAIIDGRYRILVFFWRMIPRWIWKRLPVKTK